MLQRFLEIVGRFFRYLGDPDRNIRAQIEELVDSVSSWWIVKPGKEGDLTIERAIEGETPDGQRVYMTFQQRLPDREWKEMLRLATIASADSDCAPLQAPGNNLLVRIFVDDHEVETSGDFGFVLIWVKCYSRALSGSEEAVATAVAES